MTAVPTLAPAPACPGCAAVAANPHSGRGCADCPVCRIRALADSPAFHASMIARRISAAYRAALEREFGADGWEAGHRRVKAFDEAQRAARAQICAERPA